MSEFCIDIVKSKAIADDMQSVENTLLKCYNKLDKTIVKLNKCGIHHVEHQLNNAKISIDNQKRKVTNLRNTLNICINAYERAEITLIAQESENTNVTAENASLDNILSGYDYSRLQDFMKLIVGLNIIPGSTLFYTLYKLFMKSRANTNTYTIDSVLYDNDGAYGGNQGKMIQDFKKNKKRHEELLNDIGQYFPNMTEDEAKKYLAHLNSTGCGYTAMVNTIFMQYENNPDGFLKDFGFPMYKDGDLNYDRLLLDLYTYTDINNLNDGGNGLPKGVTTYSTETILNNYMNERGVSVRSQHNIEFTANNFKEISERGGKVVLYLRHDSIIDSTNAPYYIDGGHAMVVTGVSGDRITVSSWGETYYVDLSVLDTNDGFTAIYYKDER